MRLPVQGATCLGPTVTFGLPEPSPDPDYYRRQYEEQSRRVIGRHIRFLEPPALTEYWIRNEIQIFGEAAWRPRYGMIGTIIATPVWGTLGAGPKIRWSDSHETWLGSVSQYEFLD